MSLSRWKLMAGVLGVSIGGLAAAASQCPKFDKSKGRSPESPVTAEAPKMPPAGAPSAPATPPALPVAGPTSPQLAPAGVTPPALPAPGVELPKVPAPASTLPAIPDYTPPAPAKLADVTPPTSSLPALPGIPEPSTKPTAPTTKTTPSAPTGDLIPPPPTTPASDGRDLVGTPKFTGPNGELLPLNLPGKPVATPPVVGAGGIAQPGSGTIPPIGGTVPLPTPSAGMSLPGMPPTLPSDPPAVIDIPPTKPLGVPGTVTPSPTVAATKYRILLRVGEGEPTFEVKCGDDLVMKVACEKVDIKSPEKGSGLSAVTAKGKVRFAGFGVEGTCDELSFMAGTGEVSMSGDVKVQVKDKLGRVESELSTATLKYKIDASAVGGSIKP